MNLQERIANYREKRNQRNRELYQYAREKGFNYQEASILAQTSKKRIDEEAKNKKGD
jgi:hypothetical protein